jgi:hypothetical protein
VRNIQRPFQPIQPAGFTGRLCQRSTLSVICSRGGLFEEKKKLAKILVFANPFNNMPQNMTARTLRSHVILIFRHRNESHLALHFCLSFSFPVLVRPETVYIKILHFPQLLLVVRLSPRTEMINIPPSNHYRCPRT